MHDEEAAGTRCPSMEIEPEKVRGSNMKSIKLLRLEVETRVGQVSGNDKFLGLSMRYGSERIIVCHGSAVSILLM